MERGERTSRLTFVLAGALALALAALACSAGSQNAGGAAQTAPAETQAVVATQEAGAQPTAAQATEAAQPAGTAQPAPGSSQPNRGTPEEAKSMLAQAVAHYQSVGRDQALKDFTGRVAPFFDRDLYVVCITSDHVITANGGFPQYVGTSADQLKDVNGTPVGKMMWDAAVTNNQTSTVYDWVNPASGRTEPKILFLANLGTDVCGVGAYNPK